VRLAEELAVLDKVSARPLQYPQWMLARQHGDRLPAALR